MNGRVGSPPLGLRRAGGFCIALVGLLMAARLAPRSPRQQTVHYVLGDAATRVDEIEARWAPVNALATGSSAPPVTGESSGDDWARDAHFPYARGQAPRVVTHGPRLPDGDYRVEIEIAGRSDSGAPASEQRAVVRRQVTLNGGVTSIELASSVPR